MEKVKLTKIYTTNKDKAGNQLIGKNGKSYTRMSIKTEQHGDKWISGFQNKDNSSWKEGDEVEVVIKQSGEYLNFKTPKKPDVNNEKLEKILNKLTSINLQLAIIAEKVGINHPQFEQEEPNDVVFPEEDINPDDIPF